MSDPTPSAALPTLVPRYAVQSNMSMRPISALKIALTIPVTLALAHGLARGGTGGVMAELQVLGPSGTVVVIALFFGLVALYARDLQRCLESLSPKSRTLAPRKVWLMFAIPYNFVEDFFIVLAIDRSLRRESQVTPTLRRFRSFGGVSGLGWCSAQIVSLLPNALGSIASLVAFAFWLWHWRFVRCATSAMVPRPVRSTNDRE